MRGQSLRAPPTIFACLPARGQRLLKPGRAWIFISIPAYYFAFTYLFGYG